MSHLIYLIWEVSFISCSFKIGLSGNTVRPQATGAQKIAIFFAIFNQLLSTQYVNEARFARYVEFPSI